MNRNKKYERWFMKYLVKSSVLFYSYLIIFIVTFFVISISLKLDIRKTYSAVINENTIIVKSDSEIKSIDGKVYFYANRNERVYVREINNSEYKAGKMLIYLDEGQDDIFGDIKVEVTTKRQALLSKIFLKAGKNDE